MSAATLLPASRTVPDLPVEDHYEIINGERVELPPMGAKSSILASFLCSVLAPFTRLNNLGRVVVETLFQLTDDGKLQRKPDVAFVSYERWPLQRRVLDTNAWDVVPNLAIEVNSPSNRADENLLKVQDYFRTGVQRVWIIYASVEQVYVYSSPTTVVILSRGDVLEDETLLPGFRLPVSEVFPDVSDNLASPNGAVASS
jgi:Uma2 family endonuclease